MSRTTEEAELNGLAEHIESLPVHAEQEPIDDVLFDSMIEAYTFEQARVMARAQMYLDAQLDIQITKSIRDGIDGMADEEGWVSAHEAFTRAERYFAALKAVL